MLYSTSPATRSDAIVTPDYVMDDTLDSAHLELKRSNGDGISGRARGEASDNRALFEKYTFISPGMFFSSAHSLFFSIVECIYRY